MKRIETFDPKTMERQVLATFSLVDGRLVADWRDDGYRWGAEEVGIAGHDGKTVRPKDGRLFYDALDVEYCNCSSIAVVVED